MHNDPLDELAHNHRMDLVADARRHALSREARARRVRSARVRATTAGLLYAAAARLEASATAARPRHSTGL